MAKLWILTILCALLLAGCASSADTLASPSPANTSAQPSVQPSPEASVSPSADTTVGAMGDMTPENAKTTSEQISDAVEKLTEISEAEAAYVGGTALIGVQFDDQYKGALDDRLKKMILSRAQSVDSNISGVAVTDDEKLTAQIKELYDALSGAADTKDMRTKADALAEQIGIFQE